MAKKRELQAAALFSVLVVISGCATQKPVLSSNEHLLRVGPEVAQQDIDNCMERAKATSTESGTDSSQNTVAGAATNSVAGAAAGAAGGAIVGQAPQGAAPGAVGGAVGSLTQTLLHGLFRPKPPRPSNRQLVNSCLRQKGYEPAGWK